MSKLKLGPVVEERPTKLTIEISGATMRDLTDYALVHARATGLAAPLPPEKLIAPMIERFMLTDRGFVSERRKVVKAAT